MGELTRDDLDGTLAEIARIGFRTVEIPNYMGKSPAELRAAFDRAGLRCTSAHVTPGAGTPGEPGLLGDLDLLASQIQVIGATHVIAPIFNRPADVDVPPIENEGARVLARVAAVMSVDHWKRMAAQLNDTGRRLKTHGISFGYHNHSMEFVPVGVGTAWDILLAETDPELVTFELDVGWAAAAGIDPAELFARSPGRYRLMHMKDVKASTQPNLMLRMDPAEVGSGRLDWARILPAAWKAGVREYFYEQEAPFAQSRLQSTAISYGFLSTLRA
jgi:sugar phosphate isomerase/epimerase